MWNARNVKTGLCQDGRHKKLRIKKRKVMQFRNGIPKMHDFLFEFQMSGLSVPPPGRE